MRSVRQKLMLSFAGIWLVSTIIFSLASFISFRNTMFEMIEAFPESTTLLYSQSNIAESFVNLSLDTIIMQLFFQKYQFTFIIAFFANVVILCFALFGLDVTLKNLLSSIKERLTASSEIKTQLPDEFLPIEQEIDTYKAEVLALKEQNERFQSYASHELRNELLAMRGLLVKNDIKEQSVLEHQTFLEETVADLLILSYMPNEKTFEQVDPLMIMAEVVDVLSKNKKVYFAFDENESWNKITGKESWLYRAFYNVVDNAIRYSSDEENITVSAVATQVSCLFTVSNAVNQFDAPFSEIKGHGIGLKLVKHVTQAMYGYHYQEITESQVRVMLSFPFIDN